MRYDDKAIGTTMLALIIIAVVVVAGVAYVVMKPNESLEGTLDIAGSTTVLPIAAAVAEEFMAENPDVIVNVNGGGSSVGIKSVAGGTAHIGMASRELKSSEADENPDLVQFVVAKDGIAVIVHKDNPVSQLTLDSVRKIYNGTATNWKNVGGSLEIAIVVVGRDSNSGTRASFEEMVLHGDTPVATMEQLASNGEVHDKVQSTPGAIGYVGLGYVDAEVKGVDVSDDGVTFVSPTVANVQAATYPISRNLNMFTDGTPTGLAKAYIDFLLSDAGQAIVEDEGFVPLP